MRTGALALVSNTSADRPTLVVVDDAQWVDGPTLDVLEFISRRLEGERISIVLATRPDRERPQLESVFAPITLRRLSRRGVRGPGEGGPGSALLSARESQIARLAADGLSNREIGERLFLTPRTVGSHLYRIFPKLDITSRAQLASRLA